MTSRTYVFGLRAVLHAADRYIKRWQVKLQASLTEGQYTCLLALITAITDCLIALGEAPVGE